MIQDAAQSHRRRGSAFWLRTMGAQQRSGLTQVEFCQRNELALSTFQYWRRQLRDTEAEAVAEFVEVRPKTVAPEPQADRPQAEGSDCAEDFELTFPSGLRLRVPRQVEGRALAEVLWALEATGVC